MPNHTTPAASPRFQTAIRINGRPATTESEARTAIHAMFPGGGVEIDALIDAPEGVWMVKFEGMPPAMTEYIVANGWTLKAASGTGYTSEIDIPAI